MPNTTVFLCDIYGTIDCNHLSTIEKRNEIDKFVLNLQNIKQKTESQELIISIFTSTDLDDVRGVYTTLSKVFKDTGITMGVFCCEDYIINGGMIIRNDEVGKVSHIIKFIKEISRTNLVNNIIYADDSDFNLELTLAVLAVQYKNSNLYSICPDGRKSIVDTNEQLSNLNIRIGKSKKVEI